MKKSLLVLLLCLGLTSCSFGNPNDNPPTNNDKFVTENESFIPEDFDNDYGMTEEITYKDNFTQNYDATCRVRANYNSQTKSSIQSGSGFVYDKINDNYIVVTSASRIAYKTSESRNVDLSYKGIFEFRFNDGRKYRGQYIGSYVDFDIAVFSINTKDFLPVAVLGSSDELKIGQEVGAIGTPDVYTDLFNSYVQGIVSGLNRKARTYYGNNTISVFSAFQFDAPTNNGMQGGPVLNNKNEIVGIITNKQNGEDGFESLSFAVAIDDIRNIINHIINDGEYNKLLLGFSGGSIDFLNTVKWAQDQGIYSGIYVVDIVTNGRAEKAGLPKDSVITGIKVKDKTININSMEEFQSQLVRLNLGDSITLLVATPSNNNLKEITINL